MDADEIRLEFRQYRSATKRCLDKKQCHGEASEETELLSIVFLSPNNEGSRECCESHDHRDQAVTPFKKSRDIKIRNPLTMAHRPIGATESRAGGADQRPPEKEEKGEGDGCCQKVFHLFSWTS